MTIKNKADDGVSCLLQTSADLSAIQVIELISDIPITDYQTEIKLADIEAKNNWVRLC